MAIVTSKYEEDPIKIEGAIVATTQNNDFSNTQGQLTPQSEVEPGQNSNSYEILWLFLLFSRMKKIQSKMKLLEWPQHFPHYNSMGAICCYGNQSSDPICLKTYGRQSPTPMLLHVKSDCNRPASLRDIQD